MPALVVLLPALALANGQTPSPPVAEASIGGVAPVLCAAVVGVWIAGVAVALGRSRRPGR